VRLASPSVEIEVDGSALQARAGESLAAALLAGGWRAFRRTASGDLRGPLCNMGVCFDCVVNVDGAERRACMTSVRSGLRVRTAEGEAGRQDGAD
jgi:aerobic-type carbon monoxide dehydrogenase small subunit (CoxS/CutS family)